MTAPQVLISWSRAPGRSGRVIDQYQTTDGTWVLALPGGIQNPIPMPKAGETFQVVDIWKGAVNVTGTCTVNEVQPRLARSKHSPVAPQYPGQLARTADLLVTSNHGDRCYVEVWVRTEAE